MIVIGTFSSGHDTSVFYSPVLNDGDGDGDGDGNIYSDIDN